MSSVSLSIIHTCSTKYRGDIVRLWSECLRGTPVARYDWLAEGGPAGPAVWFLAIDDSNGSVMGTCSLLPKDLFYNGKQIRGGIIGDLMVSPMVRKQGVAQRIQKKISGSLDKLGMEFLYTVPNNKSDKLLINAGIDHVLLLKNYLLPIDFDHYLKKVGVRLPIGSLFSLIQKMKDRFFDKADGRGQCDVSVADNFDKEFDDIWSIVKDASDRLIGSRSAAYLNWKFCRNPASSFQVLHYRLSTGVLVGYIIFSVSHSKLTIFEMVSTKSNHYKVMLAALKKIARTERVFGIYLWTTNNNPVIKKLWWQGFFPIDGSAHILCKGDVFEESHPWVFFPSDRNL